MVVNLAEAKAKLSKLVELAFHGEKVVIAKGSLPLVELVKHQPPGKRKLGLLAGKIHVPDDFLEEDEEINKLFYGKTDEDHH